jgi:hypothetical protein
MLSRHDRRSAVVSVRLQTHRRRPRKRPVRRLESPHDARPERLARVSRRFVHEPTTTLAYNHYNILTYTPPCNEEVYRSRERARARSRPNRIRQRPLRDDSRSSRVGECCSRPGRSRCRGTSTHPTTPDLRLHETDRQRAPLLVHWTQQRARLHRQRTHTESNLT